MPRLKARRGAFVVLTAVLISSMIALCALAIDFARLSALKGELQVSADAGAMGGAIQLLPQHLAGAAFAYDSAYAYSHRNKAMQDTVRVDSIIFGRFNATTWAFTAGATPFDAVKTIVSRQATGLFMQGFGVTMPRLTARAVAWAGAPVVSNGCIKPWAIPYPLLMSRINTYLGMANPNSTANLTRTFTASDLQTLLTMPAASRQFDMHLGGGNAVDSTNVGMAGNYQAVITTPKRYDILTNTWYSGQGAISSSAQEYRDNLSGNVCNAVTIGDWLDTRTGLAGAINTVDPLTQGPSPICTTIAGYTDNTQPSSPSYGDCRDASGNVPTVVAMYYLCVSGCTGHSQVEIKMMGAFTLDKVYSNNSNNPPMDIAEIKGTFQAYAANGRVGYTAGASPVVKIVLVH